MRGRTLRFVHSIWATRQVPREAFFRTARNSWLLNRTFAVAKLTEYRDEEAQQAAQVTHCDHPPNRNSESSRLVGDVLGKAAAGERQDADRKRRQKLIVALERRRLAGDESNPEEDHFRDIVRVGPARCDELRPFGRTTAHEDHGSVFGEDPIEPIPDRAVIVEVDAAGERDYGALRDRRLDLGPMLRQSFTSCSCQSDTLSTLAS